MYQIYQQIYPEASKSPKMLKRKLQQKTLRVVAAINKAGSSRSVSLPNCLALSLWHSHSWETTTVTQ